MDKTEFKLQMGTEKVLGKEEILEILKRSISKPNEVNPRGHQNLIIVTEELAELSQEVTKELRGKGDRFALIEEMADVCLSIGYLQEICGVSDETLQKAMSIKAKRVDEKIRKYGEFK